MTILRNEGRCVSVLVGVLVSRFVSRQGEVTNTACSCCRCGGAITSHQQSGQLRQHLSIDRAKKQHGDGSISSGCGGGFFFFLWFHVSGGAFIRTGRRQDARRKCTGIFLMSVSCLLLHTNRRRRMWRAELRGCACRTVECVYLHCFHRTACLLLSWLW